MTDQPPPNPQLAEKKKSPGEPPKRRPSLSAVFGDEPDRPRVVPVRSASSVSLDPVRRIPRTRPVPSLEGLRPFWLLIGRGGTGKTTFARLMASTLIERGISDVMIFALDPGQRLLAEFVAGIRTPDNTSPEAISAFLSNRLNQVAKHRVAGLADFGGGDVALTQVIQAAPSLVQDMEDSGVGLIAAYFFNPAADDVALLEEHARLGFTPRATALVLNARLALTPGAYDSLREQPAYQAALSRGAVEIILPRLSQQIAQEIEEFRYHFFEARDGIVPDGSPTPHLVLPAISRAMVRGFIDSTLRELAPLEAAGWLPWS